MTTWALVVAEHLSPDGLLYLADNHPLTGWLSDGAPVIDLAGRYFFRPEPLLVHHHGSYTGEDAEISEPVSFQWHHDLGEIVTAVAHAGLVIQFLHEFPWTSYPAIPQMVQDAGGNWRLPGDQLPLSFSLRAHRPG